MAKIGWPLPPRPSTRAFIREARQVPGYGFFTWLHGYVYARWPYLYIGIGTGEHSLAKAYGRIRRLLQSDQPSAAVEPEDDPPPRTSASGEAGREIVLADTYHGKVVTLASATKLVSVQQDLDLGDLERVIPYALARDIVLKHPDHIVAFDCPCRVSRQNPCLPLDVCLIVGEPFAGFVAEHHPAHTRWISSGEAAEILRAEHERGHVHHAFFKDAMLGRFYAICNCCSCCCGAMQAQRNGVKMLASSGYVARVDAVRCAGCGECETICPFGAVSVNGHSAVDAAACMGCGVCVSHCPQDALVLVRDESKGVPLELDELRADRRPPTTDD